MDNKSTCEELLLKVEVMEANHHFVYIVDYMKVNTKEVYTLYPTTLNITD